MTCRSCTGIIQKHYDLTCHYLTIIYLEIYMLCYVFHLYIWYVYIRITVYQSHKVSFDSTVLQTVNWLCLNQGLINNTRVLGTRPNLDNGTDFTVCFKDFFIILPTQNSVKYRSKQNQTTTCRHNLPNCFKNGYPKQTH